MSLDNSFSDHRWGPGKPFFARKPQETVSSLQDGRSSGTSACLGSVRLHFEGNGTIISRQGRYGQRSPCTENTDLHKLLAHQFQTYPSWFQVQLWTSWILGSWLLSFEYINHSKFHPKFHSKKMQVNSVSFIRWSVVLPLTSFFEYNWSKKFIKWAVCQTLVGCLI